MGLDKSLGRKNFLTIANGKIVLQHQNPIEGVTETRTNKKGKVVHEEFFTSVTGLVKNIESKDTPFGKVWEVTFEDEGQTYVLSFNYSSKYTNHFFRAAPNVDFTKPFKLRPWTMKDKKDANKMATGITIYQNEKKVEFAYTAENLGDMPELEQKKVKGKIQYDDSAQLEFFEEMVKNDIKPQLNGKKPEVVNEPAEGENEMPF